MRSSPVSKGLKRKWMEKNREDMHIRTVLLYFLAVLLPVTAGAKDYTLLSPSSEVRIGVCAEEGKVFWSVAYGEEQILGRSEIGMEFDVKGMPEGMHVMKSRTTSADRMLEAVVPTKFRHVRDRYNELRLSLKGGWAVVFRAYDNGVAYRFETDFRQDEVSVLREISGLDFSGDCTAYWANEKNPDFISHCEAFFKPVRLSCIADSLYSYLPVSLLTPSGTRVVVTESDLHDYPNMFLFGGDGQRLDARFPQVITETEMRTDRDVNVLAKADYIARTSGKRTYPWRILTIGDDRSLLENTLPWQLASQEISDDTDWIKPGKISWEWWSMLNVYGVDFKAGVNTETYKYHIDFAAEYGLEYILLDEGWSASTMDIVHPKPELDLAELIRYGQEKGVGVVLWTLWTPMMADMENILDTYRDWGVKGIKIDFMQRNDQPMVNFYEDVARECFERHLLVDFHGAFKPAGLQRKYPNAMTFEGVYGMEHDKCSYDISPEHDLVLPFTRMVAGPMDYTPGATINATRTDFAMRWEHPMSQGTRAHQAALFIVYESPLQMMCDSPSNYLKVPEYTSFLAAVPTVWDETVALEAKAGDYLLMARRNGDTWYVAGLNDWTGRELELDFSFLGEGEYEARIFSDGVNADTWAEDYRCTVSTVRKGDRMTVRMANGGGWAAILTPVDGKEAKSE